MTHRILHIVGTRPQVIKSAALTHVIREEFQDRIIEIKVDTGQHYDENLRDVFYREMGMPEPNYSLKLSGMSPHEQLIHMLTELSRISQMESVDGILVYGDTQTTLAGALVARNLGIPLFHVESGLRSFNHSMPEELNRIFTDHASTLLFVPSEKAIDNLKREGYTYPSKAPYSVLHPGIIRTGDVMFDNYVYFSRTGSLSLPTGMHSGDVFMTLHRNYTVDDPDQVIRLLQKARELAAFKKAKIYFPVHPRTRKQWAEQHDALLNRWISEGSLYLCEPLSYLQTIAALGVSGLVMTDSGGLQKEAYFAGKHVLVLRPETEWTELVEEGKAVVVGTDLKKIEENFNELYGKTYVPGSLYGDGNSARQITEQMLQFFHDQA